MITKEELNPHNYKPTDEQSKNLDDLWSKINLVRTMYAKPMVVRSGLRSQEDQMRINPKSPKSKHLMGQAVDIADNDGKLWQWCKDNLKHLETIGLWLEDKSATPTWVHFQTVAPKSGKRIFYP